MPHPDMNPSWVNGHPDEGLLHEWLDGQLSAGNAAEVESHVATCAECSAAVGEARGLIAASHRILSALDDVPANVIPSATNAVAEDDRGARLSELRRERERERGAAERAAPRNRWARFGKIAALLLVALVPGFYLVRDGVGIPFAGDDVTVPNKDVAATKAASPGALRTSTDAANAAQDTRVASTSLRESESQPAIAAAKRSAPGNSAPTSDAPAAAFAAPQQAAPVAGPPSAEPARMAQKSVAVDTGSAASGAANTAIATSAPAVPAPEARALALSGKVAGAQVGESRQTGNARVADASRAAEPRPTSPVPQLVSAATPPPPMDTALAKRARADSLGTSSEIERALRRAVAPAAGEIAARGNGLQLRSAAPMMAFDMIAITRTVCTTACETSVLKLAESNGRYTANLEIVGKARRTARLSNDDRDRINALLRNAIPEAVRASGQLRCATSQASSTHKTELVITRGGTDDNINSTRCTITDAALRQLADAIDAIAGTDALKR